MFVRNFQFVATQVHSNCVPVGTSGLACTITSDTCAKCLLLLEFKALIHSKFQVLTAVSEEGEHREEKKTPAAAFVLICCSKATMEQVTPSPSPVLAHWQMGRAIKVKRICWIAKMDSLVRFTLTKSKLVP